MEPIKWLSRQREIGLASFAPGRLDSTALQEEVTHCRRIPPLTAPRDVREASSIGTHPCPSAYDLVLRAAFPLRLRSVPPPPLRPALLPLLPAADRAPEAPVLPSPAQAPWVAPNLCKIDRFCVGEMRDEPAG